MNQGNIATLLQAIPLAAVLVGRGERILGVNDRATALLGPGLPVPPRSHVQSCCGWYGPQ